jgi:hypothetical protein
MSRAERRARIDAKAEELASRFGGLAALESIERERIMLAAELLLRKPISHEDRVRLVNSADRLLARVESSRRAAKQRGQGFAEALAARGGPTK